MLTIFSNIKKKPEHNFFYAANSLRFQKSPCTFRKWTFINVQNRKPVVDFWKFFCVPEYIFKQLKEIKIEILFIFLVR
jgi:hypothetical protein